MTQVKRQGILFLLLILLIGAVQSHFVHAAPPYQGGGQINFGQTTSGEITEDQYRQLYSFNGRAGQLISVTMMRDEGDLDPYLVLVSQTGTVLATSDDDGTTRNAAISSFRLTADGTFTIIATRFGHEHGSTSGTYSLHLESLGLVTASEVSNVIRYGAAVPGAINNEKPEDIYIFAAEKGDVINIHLRRTSGNLDPLLDLYSNPTGQPLRSEDDDATALGTLNAAIVNYLIPTDGTYYLRATRYGRSTGNTSGTYLLTLEVVPPDELGTRVSNARYLEYGETVSGTITDEISTRYFQFDATRGDIVSVFVARENDEDDLAPVITLFSTDLRQLAVSVGEEDQDEARLPGVSIPETASYILSISRFAVLEGATTGSFTLELTGRPGLTEGGGLEIVYGGQVNGIIDDTHFADIYVFVGRAGDVVTITMRLVDGDLDSLLTLRDETGKQVAANDDGFEDGSRNSIIRDFELPQDGIFQIEASRYERVAGTTSGSYQLTLELADEN